MNGDYPDLKPSSADSRSGNEYWDIPEFRRNYGEPLHYHFDNQQETRYLLFFSLRGPRPDLTLLRQLLTCQNQELRQLLLS
jgi:hypothetical protein